MQEIARPIKNTRVEVSLFRLNSDIPAASKESAAEIEADIARAAPSRSMGLLFADRHNVGCSLRYASQASINSLHFYSASLSLYRGLAMLGLGRSGPEPTQMVCRLRPR